MHFHIHSHRHSVVAAVLLVISHFSTTWTVRFMLFLMPFIFCRLRFLLFYLSIGESAHSIIDPLDCAQISTLSSLSLTSLNINIGWIERQIFTRRWYRALLAFDEVLEFYSSQTLMPFNLNTTKYQLLWKSVMHRSKWCECQNKNDMCSIYSNRSRFVAVFVCLVRFSPYSHSMGMDVYSCAG